MRQFVFLSILVFHVCSFASLLRVPADYSTIQTAIDLSANNDTIWIAPGTYFERLIVPDRNLTLCSDDLFTGDSLAIDNTVIDGEWEGPLITVYSQGENHLLIQGMTLKRGRGGLNNEPDQQAGGIQLQPDANLDLRGVVFIENRSSFFGAVLRRHVLYHSGEVTLNDVRIHAYRDTTATSSGVAQVSLSFSPKIVIQKLRFVAPNYPANLLSVNADTMIVSDVVAVGHHFSVGGISFGANYLRAESISMVDCFSDEGRSLSLWASRGWPEE